MKFYNELFNSEFIQYEIPEGIWTPIYLKELWESDPPIKAALDLLGVRTMMTEKILWAKPWDFVKKYIEPCGESVDLTIFVDHRKYHFSYITPPGRYLFENQESSLIILDGTMIISRCDGPNKALNSISIIEDFERLGFSEVQLIKIKFR